MVKTYEFKSRLWVYIGAWQFISLPKDMSEEIKFIFGEHKKGFGSIRVKATIGNTDWNTSIFPDSKSKTYVLPIKASVRKDEDISEGDEVECSITITNSSI